MLKEKFKCITSRNSRSIVTMQSWFSITCHPWLSRYPTLLSSWFWTSAGTSKSHFYKTQTDQTGCETTYLRIWWNFAKTLALAPKIIWQMFLLIWYGSLEILQFKIYLICIIWSKCVIFLFLRLHILVRCNLWQKSYIFQKSTWYQLWLELFLKISQPWNLAKTIARKRYKAHF